MIRLVDRDNFPYRLPRRKSLLFENKLSSGSVLSNTSHEYQGASAKRLFNMRPISHGLARHDR